MNPDEIKAFIERHFEKIRVTPRHRPDGWSCWYGEVRTGPNSTRIARALETKHGDPAKFKLSVSSRLRGESVCRVTDGEQLRRLFEQELRLWKETFGE